MAERVLYVDDAGFLSIDSGGTRVPLNAGMLAEIAPNLIGPQGPKGDRGDQGEDGQQGPTGLPGESGPGWLAGTGAPLDAVGVDGWFFMDTDAGEYYGPKTGGTWAGFGPFSLVGPQGPQGDPGLPVGPAGGDLAGEFPDPEIAEGAVTGDKIATATITRDLLADDMVPAEAAASADEALRALGTAATAAAPGATALHAVFHGATAGTARPSGAARVLWVGTVQPSNWQSNADLYLRL